MQKNKIIPKFPVEKLAVEVEEEKERKIAEQEKRLIDKAKKAKKNQKEKVENPFDTVMGEVPNKEISDMRYQGHEKILTLTHRLIKQTYKEILPNSNVYPSLLKEVLIIPPLCPQKCIESIVESMEEQVNGRYEMAIRRLEKAQEYLPKDNAQIDWQTELFFNLSFGSLYEILNYDIVAMKYYNECVRITEKLIGDDVDTSLPYCFMGELFLKLQEYDWALRSFLKAKIVRESTIGGEAPDTASTYNNLGVVAYYLESYLPAKGYFQLAYEIYKKLLGLTHPRTMMIRSNLTKMNHLNFNKEIEWKTLSKYATPAQLIKNPKKKK
jgi:tetratricopeptide (TPR) repeat protein